MSDRFEETNLSEQNNYPDPDYWRSFEELHNDPNLLEEQQHEFKPGVTDEFGAASLSGLSRRKFLALLGASAALAGAGCSDYRDKGEIIPYNKKPEEITLGKANYYASTCTACPQACGILIKTREGRPIKVDGNPDHPVNRGKICSKGQANILNLYDPERLQFPLTRGSDGASPKTDWQTVDRQVLSLLNNSNEKEVALITHSIVSPTQKRLFEDFVKKFPVAKIYSYELFHDQIRQKAWEMCYGKSQFPLIKWNKAKVILSLEADFLGSDGNKVEQSRLFSSGRDVMNTSDFNRLYVAEAGMTITGMNADYRLRIKPELQYNFVMSLLNELVLRKQSSRIYNDSNLSAKLKNFSLKEFAAQNDLPIQTLNLLIDDLLKHPGKSIVYAGRSLSLETHIAVNLLNEILDAVKLYNNEESTEVIFTLTSDAEWQELINKMNSGSVAAVIHFDTNPLFHLPNDLGYESALGNVKTVISLVESENETSGKSGFILPVNHNFESWGDASIRTGVYSLQQPVIAPLYDTRQKEAVLLNWINGDIKNYNETIYHTYLMNNWEKAIYPEINSPVPFKQFWNAALHDGVVKSRKTIKADLNFNSSAASELPVNTVAAAGYTVMLTESYSIGDGKFANNGWLQELPQPVSKVTWDNYAAVSEKTAKELAVKTNDLIQVKVGNRKLTLPVLIQPGLADRCLTIDLGYGRKSVGTVGSNVGFNASVLKSKDYSISPWIYNNIEISKVDGNYSLVTTQDHHAFDIKSHQDLHFKRKIIQEGALSQYRKDPKFLQEGEKQLESVYKPHAYPGLKWGMSIDLNKCIGCSECVIACNVENNIPVVGKEQVKNGREMMWLRIDRYYSGSPENPKVSSQPMLCQHCDQAPCENVCPVAATNHSPDGLNQMIYNRCVGTRYCSNNCPYKVRRFNFFNFRAQFKNGFQEQPVFALLQNPEVTVRSRGVMEKCTFCIQRIAEAREEAVKSNNELKGSDVKTACQQACNTNAIVFGDIHDKNSEFYKYRNHELGYYVLEELNVKPNITYIAKLRNTHSEEA